MEKKKLDFIYLIILQVLAYLVASILEKQNGISIPASVIPLLMISVFIPFYYFIFRVTSNFIQRRHLRNSYGVLLFVQFVLNGYVNRTVPIGDIRGWAMLSYMLQLTSFTIIFCLIIINMFKSKHDSVYSLLAATNAYLLIPVIFGYIYSMISVNNPALLGSGITIVRDVIQASFQVSFYILAGIDIPEGIGELIKRIAVLESLMGNLYIVFVVGRLLANN